MNRSQFIGAFIAQPIDVQEQRCKNGIAQLYGTAADQEPDERVSVLLEMLSIYEYRYLHPAEYAALVAKAQAA